MNRNNFEIWICDDQIEHIKEIIKCITELSAERRIFTKSFVHADDVKRMLQERAENERALPKLLLLDISMPDVNGISFAKLMRDRYPFVYVVFLTAFPEYAIQGYEAEAFRYLLKPLRKQDLEKVICDILSKEARHKQLVFQTCDGPVKLNLDEILYISAQDKYSFIHTRTDKIICTASLKNYEEKLCSYGFFRIHRKYIVNLFHHCGFVKGKIRLSNEEELHIAKSRIKSYQCALLNFFKGDVI